MAKPDISEFHLIHYKLETESRLAIVSTEGGKSWQTLKFPAHTDVMIYVSKKPVEEP